MAQVGEKIALGAIGRLGGELGIQGGLLGALAVGDELSGARQAQGRAVRRALGLRARAHPLVVPVLVQHAKFDVVDGADGRR